MIIVEEKYMRRALQLAALSPFYTHPNPMVGCVIVHDGRIIGEGWHRRCGQGHAEVNAIASVSEIERPLLTDSTMYVTLEPCSHYGKTPPCAKLIIDNKIPRVVVGAVDPFEKVSGRGIAMLRSAGVEVVDGVLAEESRRLNKVFFTAHTLHRPFVTLKWAQSSDGFMDADRNVTSGNAYRFSTALSTVAVHRRRALADVILSTVSTVEADSPRFDTRVFAGPSPRRVIVDVHVDIVALLARLYSQGVTSVLVEAGPRFLQAMIDSGLWDEAVVETSPVVLAADGRHKAPVLPIAPGLKVEQISSSSLSNTITTFTINAGVSKCAKI